MKDAQTITLELNGRWHGGYGSAPCPICQPDRRRDQNALTLADGHGGRILLHCKKLGCSFTDIAGALGLGRQGFGAPDPALMAQREADQRNDALKRARQAQAVWNATQPIDGTLAETYLRSRGITCDLPPMLRFNPSCWHRSAAHLPAMIAMVEGCDLMAVHRTYLDCSGQGKAKVDPAKAMLGACAGGAVRLTDAPGRLVVCEGIETGLSLASGLLHAPATIWAALSTSGIRSLRLPSRLGRLMIASDGDQPGREAAHVLATRADDAGWKVTLLPAPDGRDWNDMLHEKGVAA